MKTRSLKNYGGSRGVEVYDIDLNSDDEIIELGKLVTDQCVVFIDQNITDQRLYKIMAQWGQPSRALMHEYIAKEIVQGRHWRELFVHLGYIGKEYSKIDMEMARALSVITYQRDEQDRPRGMFQQGELEWHSDQCATDDSQRMIGLKSDEYSANSQTQFLCTHDAFESLSSSMQSTVRDLVCKHKWNPGTMASGLNAAQELVLRYNMVPLDGMETRLYQETATGLSGMKFPPTTFNGFVGMSLEESNRLMDELKKVAYQEKYVYTQDWVDGQIVFMDQIITLHKRPTNIQHGNRRKMTRCITYLDKLFPNAAPREFVRYSGQLMTQTEFAKLVDDDRRAVFEKEQNEEYVSEHV